ncbi:hypothetical protein IFM89_027894 [Coptis chinensis]|uniref:Myb/SANT-like domain-containing protein n=1 Tax=Coptis chinensis TaxID=261450 RepID=A0A835HG36_9MAGN|nr:hypothetical protein IFM89_027894 [Coptis chinensis]
MCTHLQLLMQWTRGKNLIFSSAAPSVCEIRGPYDVANLSCLLGLSMERAKAAIFKNSRSLLLNTVRKKQYFKNAIRIERISPIKPVDSKEAWFCDGNGWDHISSGEGDLLLDDIAKSFASTVKVTKTSKASDVAPVFDEISSHDIHLKDLCPGSGGELHQPNVSATKELKDSHEVFKQLNELELVPIAGAMLLASTPLQHQSSGCQDFPNTPPVFTDDMEIEILANGLEKDKDSCCTVPITVEFVSHGKVSKDSEHNCAENHVSREDAITLVTPMEDIESSVQHVDPRGSSDLDMVSSSFIDISTIESDVRAAMNTLEHSTPANEIAPYSSNEDDKRLNGVDVVLDTGGVRIMEVLGEDDKRETTRFILAGCDMFTDSGYSNREKNEPPKYSAVPHDDKMLGVSFSENQAYVNSAKFLQHEDTSVESDDQKQFKSGIGRSMRRIFPRGFQFALKRFLHPMLFKKKSRSYSKKSKQNICSGELQSAKCGRKCDPIMKDRFIELCLLELNNGGRLGETLKPSSWTRIEKEMKRKFGVSYKKRQWKTNLELLKQQYHICVDLTKKVGYGYNVASNAIDWSPEMWEKYEKTRSEAKQFRRQRLQYADDLASLLDDIVESRA